MIIRNKLCIQCLQIILMLVFLTSCMPLKKVSYFNDSKYTIDSVDNPLEQKRISPFDQVYIKVMSTDEKTARIFSNSDMMITDLSTNLVSYMVDERGIVNFPFAGEINIGGSTTVEASIKIQTASSEYIGNTAVIVRYIDNKVTVLGEVQHQGVFQFNTDKINIYEAISLAGGMTKFGNHKNTYIVRQVDKKLIRYKVDLSNSNILSSHLYYILPNDILIIEPNKNISWSYQNLTFTTFLSTVTTLIAVLYFANIHF